MFNVVHTLIKLSLLATSGVQFLQFSNSKISAFIFPSANFESQSELIKSVLRTILVVLRHYLEFEILPHSRIVRHLSGGPSPVIYGPYSPDIRPIYGLKLSYILYNFCYHE
jgi:hypothetical protein